MANQLADYELTGTVQDDGVIPCLSAHRPMRLGGGQAVATIWILGPLARAPWATALARLAPLAGARSPHLPDWLEAGIGEWAQRPVVWVSAANAITGSLAAPATGMTMPGRLRALASAARGAHALHESGQLHGAICPQAVALSNDGAVLAPPALANGERPLVQVGYPPLGYVDPQLLRGEGGRWSDVWSLGATVRQVVTGSAPFPGIEELPVVKALAQLLASPLPAPADVPPALADLVNRCLAVDPEARPATANEVAEQLEEAAVKW